MHSNSVDFTICHSINTWAGLAVLKSDWSGASLRIFQWQDRLPSSYTGCPNKNATFLTKHETIAFCSISKILFDSKRVGINLDFDTLDSPICKIFFEVRKFKNINVFFQESILGNFRGISLSSALEMTKIVYISQDACRKVRRSNICSYLINFERWVSKWKTSRNYRYEEYRENSKTDASKVT